VFSIEYSESMPTNSAVYATSCSVIYYNFYERPHKVQHDTPVGQEIRPLLLDTGDKVVLLLHCSIINVFNDAVARS
jgi:hypothetical protein